MAGCVSLVAACSVTDDGLMADADLSAESIADTVEMADAGASVETETADEADATDMAAASNEGTADEVETAAAPADATVASDESTEIAEAEEEAATEETAASDEPSAVTALSEVEEEKPEPSPFAKLFSRPKGQTAETGQPNERGVPALSETTESAAETDIEQEPDETTTASIASGSPQVRLSVAGDGAALPGVREVRSIYELSSRDRFELNDYSEDGATVQVASAVGLAALAGSRLAVQHENVDVSCFKPRLVNTLRQIESHFGRPVVVTSGYRSKKHNRRVGGARESQHMNCAAADIQVAGVSKWDIAEYVRALPGRGGVGTYCHTKSVHVDVGAKRDWNWRCRRGN